MFEKASRKKLRFNYHGSISVEDLWDLSVEDLDDMYGLLRTEQKETSTESLLKSKRLAGTNLDLRINLVKHVVETKLQEADERENRAIVKLQKEKIAELIQAKKDDGLKEMTVEELQEKMDEL